LRRNADAHALSAIEITHAQPAANIFHDRVKLGDARIRKREVIQRVAPDTNRQHRHAPLAE